MDEGLGSANGPDIRQEATSLFTDMGLENSALIAAWGAFEQEPGGTVAIALASFEGRNPAGLFLYLIGRGDHKRAAMNSKRRTGWTWVRGTHSGTYVRNPRGTDPLPSGYGQ